MACAAIVTEIPGDVIGIGRLLEVRGMACVTVDILQGIVSACMTVLTCRRRVLPRQGESSARVIERRSRPSRGRVALRAILSESGGGMRRILGAVVVRRVARITGSGY